jgi:small nuclear ribonucleoprotein (snRNP)-like protein
LSVAEIAQHTDVYAEFLGRPVKVWLRDQVEVYSGTLHSLDNGQGRIVLLDLHTRQPCWWPERVLVSWMEPLDQDGDTDGGAPPGGYRSLPGRPAGIRPEAGEQPSAAEARALTAVDLFAQARLMVGVWLAAPSARRRAEWARTGHWRHRAGSLTTGPVRIVAPGAVAAR